MTRTPSPVALKARLTTFGTAALLALGGCAATTSTAQTTTTGVSSPSALASATRPVPVRQPRPSTTSTSPATPIVVAVRAFWSLYLQLAGRTGTFNRADTQERLRTRVAGAELSRLYDVFAGDAAAGLVVKGTIRISPSVVSTGRTTALVWDCFDDETGLYRVRDGRRLDVKDRRRHAVFITLTRMAGVWKVSAMRDEGLGCRA
ncbi:MAG TPA: hypothetical protein VK771_01785 [Acidimicrobiia bacterium]|nr:hypothetical protein [Acidimicrobiia bacterium]